MPRFFEQRQSLGILNSGPLKILSGSFQSLAFLRGRRKSLEPQGEPQESEGGQPGSGLYQRRILLARRSDGSLGVGLSLIHI